VTEISPNNGLNEPEFFWSPFFGKRYRFHGETIEMPFLIEYQGYSSKSPKHDWLHLIVCVEGVEFNKVFRVIVHN